MNTTTNSNKSGILTLILCAFLGLLGIHRFYVGKKGSGFLMLITCGLLGLWTLLDLLLILANRFKDKFGNPIIVSKSWSTPKKLLLIATSLIIWFGIYLSGVAYLLTYTNTALVTVAEKQLDALSHGNINEAYIYNSKSFQKNLSLELFKQYLDKFPVLKNANHTNFPIRKTSNYVGLLVGTLTSKDGRTTPIEYEFIKENGSWKILNIKIMPSSR